MSFSGGLRDLTKPRTASWYSGLVAEAEAAGDFADLEAAVAVGVVGDELVEERAEVVAELAGGEFLLGGDGLGAGGGVRGWGFVG